jgi:hypothetical protein
MLLASWSASSNSNSGFWLRVPLPLALLKTLSGLERKAFTWVGEQPSAQEVEFKK